MKGSQKYTHESDLKFISSYFFIYNTGYIPLYNNNISLKTNWNMQEPS